MRRLCQQTGRSRHYAFIEFKNAEVARIVAETMDNYLMFGRMLKCTLVECDRRRGLHSADAQR